MKFNRRAKVEKMVKNRSNHGKRIQSGGKQKAPDSIRCFLIFIKVYTLICSRIFSFVEIHECTIYYPVSSNGRIVSGEIPVSKIIGT